MLRARAPAEPEREAATVAATVPNVRRELLVGIAAMLTAMVVRLSESGSGSGSRSRSRSG